MSIEPIMAKPYALFFLALANESRMRVLELLRENGSMSVSQICYELGLEQTLVSHTLKCLTFCGLVKVVRQGKSRIYSMNAETVIPLLKLVDKHLTKFANNLYNCDVLER
jgi:DNA-binding transcriptional ArsR family regulator